jgi:pyridoxine/pyridoxamine 5'-phosphate oxidase
MNEAIKAILDANLVGTLATINEDGSPWATPVHVIAGEEGVYWFSKDTHQHSLNVLRDPRVSLSLWARIEATKGGYIQGKAVRLDSDAAERAFASVRKPDGTLPGVFENTSPYFLPIGSLNRDKSSENRWYFYS